MAGKLDASIAVGFGREDWWRTVDFVVEAERLGVKYVWAAEAWGSDAVTPLAYLAAKTSTIKLGTGIMQAGTRTPALVGMTAGTLSVLSGGRFILGLGTSGPQVIEGWHGLPFEQPVRRLREIIDIARQVMAGERVSYDGRVYELPRPGGEGKALRSSMPPVPPVPVYLATLGPRSLRMTGEIADGWLGTSFMPEHAGVFFDHIQAGAEEAGRSMGDLDLQAGGAVAFGEDLAALIAPRKQGVAFTLGAMGSRENNFYNEAFQRAGYQDIALEIQGLWLDGRREEAVERVPDELVLQTNLLGTEEHVRQRIRAYCDAGVTTIRVDPVGRTLDERVETLRRFMGLLAELGQE
jgi:F420-dependent oxidoreductase-like protein